jgi:hypothetical protein
MIFVKLILVERCQKLPIPSSDTREVLIVVWRITRTASPLKMFARAIVRYTTRGD